jgi:hypothetical protein
MNAIHQHSRSTAAPLREPPQSRRRRVCCSSSQPGLAAAAAAPVRPDLQALAQVTKVCCCCVSPGAGDPCAQWVCARHANRGLAPAWPAAVGGCGTSAVCGTAVCWHPQMPLHHAQVTLKTSSDCALAVSRFPLFRWVGCLAQQGLCPTSFLVAALTPYPRVHRTPPCTATTRLAAAALAAFSSWATTSCSSALTHQVCVGLPTRHAALAVACPAGLPACLPAGTRLLAAR